MKENEKKYLSFFNKFGYGCGDLADNLVWGLVSSFLMLYLTNAMGMDPAIIGTLILVSKLLDGVTDIFFGTMIDRTHSKMGKARPWMLWSFVGCAVTLVATFAIPESLGATAQYAYFFIFYTLLNAVFFTATNISYSALTSLITKNSNERVQMGTFRFFGSNIGNMVVSNAALVLVEILGGGTTGWKWTAVIFAVAGLIVNTFAVFSVKELPEEAEEETVAAPLADHTEKVSFFETMKILLTNKYFILLAVLYLLFYMMQTISMSTGVFFFLYNCGDPGWFGKYITASTIGSFVGLILAPILVKRFNGIRKLQIGAFSINFVCRIVLLILAMKFMASSVVVMFGIVAVTMCTLGGTYNALVSEAADYSFFKTGKRVDGSMYSCTSFGIKVGSGLGSAIQGWLLAAGGFAAEAAVQSVQTTNMLTFMFAGVPLIITAVVVIIYILLDVESANKKIRAERQEA